MYYIFIFLKFCYKETDYIFIYWKEHYVVHHVEVTFAVNGIWDVILIEYLLSQLCIHNMNTRSVYFGQTLALLQVDKKA
jgi:hypothetical protein